MILYSRAQLRLLLGFAAILLVGLGVREWRAGFPGAAQRLESFDRAEAPAPPSPVGESGGAPQIAADGNRSIDSIPARAPYESPPPAADPRPLDLNRATLAELARLPGVSPSLAERILAERERQGRFESPEALRRIKGVGPKKLATLRDLVTVGE